MVLATNAGALRVWDAAICSVVCCPVTDSFPQATSSSLKTKKEKRMMHGHLGEKLVLCFIFFLQAPKTLKPLLRKSDHLKSESMWSDIRRLDGYEMSGRKKEKICFPACKSGIWRLNCLAYSCIGTQKVGGQVWGGLLLNLSGCRGEEKSCRKTQKVHPWTLQSCRNRSWITFRLLRQS